MRNVSNSSSEKESIDIVEFTGISNVNREIINADKKEGFEIDNDILEGSPVKGSINSILAQLERNEITEALIEEWHDIIMNIFEEIEKEDDKKYKSRLYNELQSRNYIVDNSDGVSYFIIYLKKVVRRIKKNEVIDDKMESSLFEIGRQLLHEYRSYVLNK